MTPVELRHAVHMNPELSGEEHETQKLLLEALSSVGYSPRPICETGVLAVWSPGDGPFHLFRADIDALPLVEETGWRYASKNGRMHACGHDVHTAILFGLAKRTMDRKPKIDLLFLFQPAEETGGGAKRCVEELKELGIEPVDAFALHVTDEYPLGTVASRAGTLFASAYEVDVSFLGKSAHVAERRNGVDAIEVAAAFLERVYGTDWGESVIGFGRISGGDARNVVANRCDLEGTMRSTSWRENERLLKEIEILAVETARSHGAKCRVSTGSTYPEVSVDEKLLKLLQHACEETERPFVNCEMKFTGEDFGFLSREYPSLMFWLGTRVGGERHGLHNPRFLPPDEAIEEGIEILWKLVELLESEAAYGT